MTKTFKKSVAFLSAVAMVMAMLLYFPSGMFSNIDWGLSASAAEITPSQPNVGDGSKENPYKISTAAELYWFAALVNGTLSDVTQNTAANAVLTDNITVNTGDVENAVANCNGIKAEDWIDWTPIGNDSNRYTGTFNGQKHKISGLYFNNSSTDYVGLFGFVGTSGSVSNVGVVDSYFNGGNKVGGVCGFNNVSSLGTATIENCYNTGNVSGTSYVGGVCGGSRADSGQGTTTATITNCHNTGEVSGTGNYVGGVCGYNKASSYVTATIENCYNTGNVSGSKDVGGVCGFNCAAFDVISTATITNCYNTGTVDGSNDVGGVCGWNENGTITDCYNNTGEVRGSGSVGGVCGKNYAVNTFDTAAVKATITNCHNTGEVSGSKNNVGGVCGINDAAHYGTATITDCDNTGSVTGGKNVGGVCGYNNAASETSTSTATITNCHNTGSVTGTDYYVGGVCGENYANSSDTATIINCYNTGEVSSSKNYVGGVCGFNNANSNGTATITNCYNRGTVSGLGSGEGSGNYIGGVCGYNVASDETSKATITNCYNTGAVSGSSNVGGVCGWIDGGTISNCYNTASVTGSYAGGVCGLYWVEPSKTATVTITNCYYLNDTADKGIGLCKDEDEVSALASAKSKTSEDFSEGEVCYLLNGEQSEGTAENPLAWYQNIDRDGVTADAYPVLDKNHGIVYACNPCTGVFSNTEGQTAEHSYVVDTENGKKHKCKKCGETHNAEFNADDTTDTISICHGFGTVTLKAPTENLTYDGTAKAATVEGELTGIETPNILYMEKNGTGEATETVPTNAGTYIASITYTISETKIYSVSVEFTIEQAEPDVTVDTNQNVVCGVGTFSEPTFNGVDGNTLAGTIEYSIADKTKATADEVKNYLKTLPKGSKSSIGYTFTPTDTTNYSTATGTINYTMVDVAFMVGEDIATIKNAVTVKANPTYGDTWAEILTLNTGLKAVLPDETVTTGFSFDVTGSPDAGTQTYKVLFNGTIGGKTYTDFEVISGTVNVAPKLLTVSEGTYKVSKVYDGSPRAGQGNSGTLTVNGIINNDNVTVNTGIIGEYSASDVGNDYKVAVAISLSGDNESNYTLGTVSSIKVPAEITAKEITLTDDTAKVTGEYHYTGSAIVPTVEVKDGDTTLTLGTDYTVTCTDKAVGTATATIKPVKGGNYTFTDKDVTFTIKKATGSPSNAPTSLTGCVGAKVSTASLPTGWVWDNEDTTFPETAGETGNATANYTGDDAGNYSVISANVTLTAAKHDYSDKQLCSAATCTSAAKYYKKCSVCGDVDKSSTFTYGSALGHNLITAGGYKAPTCSTAGKYANRRCSRCSYSVTGSTIPATGKHVYSAETVKETALISEATCKSPALYHKSCATCGLVSTSDTDVFTDGDALAHDYTSGGICKVCEDLKNSRDGFRSASVTLTDGVIINYNLLLSDEALADTGAYIHFTSPQGLDVKIMLSKGVKENDRYKFSLKLRPDQMADLITAQVVYSDGSKGNSVDYSVTKYADNVKNNADSATSKTSDLIDAMLYYGAATQSYTGNNTDNSADENISKIFDSNVKIADDYKMNIDGTVSGIKIKGASLIAGSLTTIKVKYQVIECSISDFTFTCDGTELTPVKQGDFYYVYIRDISPDNIDKMYNIVVTDKNGNSRTLEYSALTYAKSIIEDTTGKYPESLVNMMKALYYYNKAADAYSN